MLLTRGTGDVSMKSLSTLTESKPLTWHGSVGEDLQHLEKDRAIHTDPNETRRRRTIKLLRENNTWGFTLQTYGIKNKKTNELEVMTYVDYVELNGPAGLAGMRRGDVILSVNGDTVEGVTHKTLVGRIQETKGTSLRLVVLFEDCCRKVELYERFIKLKQVLKMKLEEYRHLEKKEHYILEGHGGFSRFSSVRSSLKSSTSSDWDRFSMVVSPAQMLQNLPTRSVGPQHFLFPRPYPSSVDDSSEISLNDAALNDSFSDDSDAFLNSSASCSDILSLQGLRRSKKDSLSNRSVSSLITNSDIHRRDLEKGYSSDADTSQTESLPVEDTIKGDNSTGSETNSVSVKSGDVVFTLEQEEKCEDCDVKNVPEDKSNEEFMKGDNLDDENKGDNSDTASDLLETNDFESVNTLSVRNESNDSGFYSAKGDNSVIGEKCTTNVEPSNHMKRLVNGILINDDDQTTKL